MAAFAGTWDHASTENFDAYLKALGVPENLSKLMADSKDIIVITVDGDTWTFYNKMGDKDVTVTLKVGQMVDYKTITGDSMKGIIKSVADNKMVEEHFLGDLKIDTIREIINGQLAMTYTANGVTGKMFYDRK